MRNNVVLTNETLPEIIDFRGSWRSYQRDFLEDIRIHLLDKKLNVVAAPGAGKTTLGIEIIKRLNKPALILAPTITIKNQWKQRIVDGFLQPDADTSWISTSIKDIKTITSTTYQALHTLLKDSITKDKFIEELKKHGIKTLVLDESHHLRTEWYRSLEYLCSKLSDKDFRVVSLTATPPYDVSVSEWSNYYSLCGPVDAEISIPELVKNGDLCFHQDLLWFSDLSREEKKIVFDYEENRRKFFDYLNKKSDFSYSVKTSVFVSDYENHIEIIYDDTDFTIALISYLLSIDDMNIEAKVLTEFLALETELIPAFDYDTAEVLFNGILGKYKKYFKNVPILKSKLKEYGLLKSATCVDFKGESDFKKLYARSINKLDSIKQITKLESEILEEDLREVVLLDYIGGKNVFGLSVLTVFDAIDELSSKNPLKAGILTGSLIVIPKTAKTILYDLLQKYGIKNENVLTDDFKEGYLRVETYGSTNLVPVITELFEKGEINVLTGTQALLGEGWDAPCVNTLIIASSVGSFMLSNQIRGRALRTYKRYPQKTADIWHLVSLTQEDESFDLNVIKRRFETFEGISFVDDKIRNGLFRLGYDSDLIKKSDCEKLNEYSRKKAQERFLLNQRWNQVFYETMISESKIRPQVYEAVQMQDIKLPSFFYKEYKNSIFKFFRNFIGKYYIRYTQKELFEIARALLKTMCETNVILSSYDEIKPVSNISFDNNKKTTTNFLTLVNCSNYERNIFVKTLNEMFSAPEKQRYILKKSDNKTGKECYLAVPEIIGTNKNKVKIFEKNLEPVIGYMNIIFTRNPEGRKELLKARFNTLEMFKVQKSKIWI
ncbi:MAG: DEAD/DEAH box helicase family protein [Clostridium sp.]|nr:DEAD/DEAH box helicase family protein [Clostridium sp.]